MGKRLLIISAVFVFAFLILFISVLRTAAVKYSYKLEGAKKSDDYVIDQNEILEDIFIDYYLPSPGPVLPDHPLWKLKALRDKLWLLITTNENRKAQLYLLFADKRLTSAKLLSVKGKYELSFTTLSKAEKYLAEASELETKMRNKGIDTLDFATTLIKASFKHRQIIKQILLVAPNDARSDIVLVENLTRGIYGSKASVLQDRGVIPPPDPFNGL